MGLIGGSEGLDRIGRYKRVLCGNPHSNPTLTRQALQLCSSTSVLVDEPNRNLTPTLTLTLSLPLTFTLSLTLTLTLALTLTLTPTLTRGCSSTSAGTWTWRS